MRKVATVVVVVLCFVGCLVGWYLSGRDLQTLRDGMSTDFRKAGADVVDAQTPLEIHQLLPKAKRAVTTGRDAEIYKDMEAYSKAITQGKQEKDEAESEDYKALSEAHKSLSEGHKVLALLQRKQARLLLEDAAACRKKLLSVFPYNANVSEDEIMKSLPLPDPSSVCWDPM